MRRIGKLIFSAGGAVMFPLCAFGHGAEFLLAKLSIARSGECVLEVTADYGDNPMLQDENEARSALKNLLQITSNGRVHELDDLAQPIVEKRSKPDPNAPGYRPDQDKTQEHKLLLSRWRWQPQSENFSFQLPNSNPHTALLWLVDERVPQGEPRWVMMIAGDKSPVIQVPRQAGKWWLWGMMAAAFGMALLAWRRFARGARNGLTC